MEMRQMGVIIQILQYPHSVFNTPSAVCLLSPAAFPPRTLTCWYIATGALDAQK